MTNPFLDRLQDGPILADGAMGTMLYAAGVSFNTCFDQVNLSDPELVGSIHRLYMDAGAELIETNSFGANRFKLAQYGLESQVREINKAAVRIAREAREVSGKSVLVSGAVGPTGVSMQPIGKIEPSEVQSAFREQVEALEEFGVDLFTIETIPTVAELHLAVAAIRACSDLPIVAMMSFAEDGRSIGGDRVEKVLASLIELRVDVIGANCSVGPQKILRLMERFQQVMEDTGASVPLACLPNAGWPTQVAGRIIYPSSPDYFRDFAQSAAAMGVRLIGGCCGTTPEHVREFARLAKAASPHIRNKRDNETKLSGLEPLTISKASNFINIGDRHRDAKYDVTPMVSVRISTSDS